MYGLTALFFLEHGHQSRALKKIAGLRPKKRKIN